MDGKRKYKSLGVSVRAEHWNFEKNIPKSNCPNKEYINILIANKKKEYETEIVKLKSEDKLFTANTLNEQVSNSVKPKTVEEAFNEYLRLLQEENRRGFNHSSVTITKRYLGLRQEELLNTYDCLSF